MRKPGFEPGLPAWEAEVLTTVLFTHLFMYTFYILG